MVMPRSLWENVSKTGSLAEIRGKICTAGPHECLPANAFPLPADFHVKSVLDFGCGLGRNFPLLRKWADTITGYDLPSMIERCKEVEKADVFTSVWEEVRILPFDATFVSLVLQHMLDTEVAAVITDFHDMSPLLLVASRITLDSGRQLQPFIEEKFKEREIRWSDLHHDHFIAVYDRRE